MNSPTLEPYCGPAPIPETLMSQWNADPAVIGAVLLAAVLLWRRSRGGASRAALAGAVVLLFAAFVSPLCALASALFSARVLHHVLLVSCAAPLIAFALPPGCGRMDRLPAQASFLVHALFLWFWHAPGPYSFALSSDAVYWTMEATLLGSAVWLWRDILRRPLGASLALLLGTVLQMGMLGALLTFARAPLFLEHLTTTGPFGLTPLEDQQLSGLVMWVPAALPYLAVALLRLHGLLSGERPQVGNAAP